MIAALAAAAVLAAAPGVTPTTIVVGAVDTPAAAGADAYFRYANDRGGIHGRSVELQLDGLPEDAFATLAAAPLDGPPAVGDVLPGTAGEAEAYGRWLAANAPTARVAVLYDDPVALAALRRGLGAKRSLVVAATAVDETTDVAAAVADLRATGATALCVLAAADDVLAALAGWKPQLLVRGATTPPPNGAITATTVKDPTAAIWSDDPGIALYRRILARYAKGLDPRDPQVVAGMASAFAAVDALRRAGASPTRAGLAKALAALNEANNPFLLPGVRLRPASGVAQVQLVRRVRGRWQPTGGVVVVRA